MELTFFKDGKFGGPPAGRAVTDASGRYRVPRLLVGRYQAQLRTRNGTLITSGLDVTVTEDGDTDLTVAIEPTGRVYNGVNGELIDGVRVFIYEDRDTDEDPTDAESRELCTRSPHRPD